MSVWAKPPPLDSASCHIVFIEDDALLRELLKASLTQRFHPASIQEFDNANAGLEACIKDKPDLLITDLRLPDMDGRDVIRRLRARQQPVRVIVLTSYVDSMLPTEMIALGVAGLVDKSSSLDHVERAVQSVLAGGLYFASSMSPVPSVTGRRADASGTEVGPSALSERERIMAQMVAQGLRSKEIADRLGLNPRTAEKHRTQLMEKLGLSDTTSLVRWCIRHGLD